MLSKPHVWGRTLIVSIVAVFLYHNMPVIEGKLFPVATPIEISVVEADVNGWALISGTFKKNRDCTFDRIDWYWVSKNSMTRIAIEFPLSKQRLPGNQNFLNWRLQMPFKEVKKGSVGYVYHQCHPLYLTVTKIYP